jgi:DNA-binding transcriptional regulator YbjK
MNPKLHKERIRTSSQRPDIVIAFQNFFREQGLRGPAHAALAAKGPVPKQSA